MDVHELIFAEVECLDYAGEQKTGIAANRHTAVQVPEEVQGRIGGTGSQTSLTGQGGPIVIFPVFSNPTLVQGWPI